MGSQDYFSYFVAAKHISSTDMQHSSPYNLNPMIAFQHTCIHHRGRFNSISHKSERSTVDLFYLTLLNYHYYHHRDHKSSFFIVALSFRDSLLLFINLAVYWLPFLSSQRKVEPFVWFLPCETENLVWEISKAVCWKPRIITVIIRITIIMIIICMKLIITVRQSDFASHLWYSSRTSFTIRFANDHPKNILVTLKNPAELPTFSDHCRSERNIITRHLACLAGNIRRASFI